MIFDSGLAAATLLLLAASLFVWTRALRASVRLNLRFAAVLFASLAVSALAASLSPAFAGLSLAVAALVAGLGSVALGLCVFALLSRTPPQLGAGLVLGAGLILGLLASLSGQSVFVLAAIIPAAAVMIALGFGSLAAQPRMGIETLLGAVALLGGGMALMQDALTSSLLFFAAGLTVKIDGSYVKDLQESPENQVFVRTLVGLAKNLGMKTVAEWVGSDADAALLQSFGVDYFQGFHFGEPLIDPAWAKV